MYSIVKIQANKLKTDSGLIFCCESDNDSRYSLVLCSLMLSLWPGVGQIPVWRGSSCLGDVGSVFLPFWMITNACFGSLVWWRQDSACACEIPLKLVPFIDKTLSPLWMVPSTPATPWVNTRWTYDKEKYLKLSFRRSLILILFDSILRVYLQKQITQLFSFSKNHVFYCYVLIVGVSCIFFKLFLLNQNNPTAVWLRLIRMHNEKHDFCSSEFVLSVFPN